MRRKLIGYTMGIVFMATTICSCSTTGNNNNQESVTATKEGTVTSANKETDGKTQQTDFKVLYNGETITGCGNENGYYTIVNNEENLNIMYVDYQSKQQIYLCDKSDCKHDSEKCSSYIEPKYFARQNMLLCDDDYLYFVSSEYNQAGGTSSSNFAIGEDGVVEEQMEEPTCIYRMNLDGTDRILLASFDTGEVLEGRLFSDESYFYTVVLKNKTVELDDTSNYTYGSDYELVSISKENGNRTKVCDWDSDWSILGCYKRQLIVEQVVFEHELTQEERMDSKTYSEAYKSAKDQIVSYEVDSGTTSILIETEMKKNYQYLMGEKDIFYYMQNGEEIRSYDLEKNKDDVFLETKYCNIEGIYDGYLLTSDFKEENKRFYLTNSENGKTEEFTLIEGNGYPINVIAGNDGYYFVESNCKLEEEYVEWVGVTQEIETNREYSLISKDDFTNNQGNFEQIKMLVQELE